MDDNTPTVSDKDPNNLLAKMQQACDKVTTWFSANDLTCSGEKTKLLNWSAQKESKIDQFSKKKLSNAC